MRDVQNGGNGERWERWEDQGKQVRHGNVWKVTENVKKHGKYKKMECRCDMRSACGAWKSMPDNMENMESRCGMGVEGNRKHEKHRNYRHMESRCGMGMYERYVTRGKHSKPKKHGQSLKKKWYDANTCCAYTERAAYVSSTRGQ
jgi:hypothetical protein